MLNTLRAHPQAPKVFIPFILKRTLDVANTYHSPLEMLNADGSYLALKYMKRWYNF